MKNKKYRFRKTLKVICILLALLLSLLSAAAGEEVEETVPAEAVEPIADEVIVEEAPAQSETAPEEQPPASAPDTEEEPEPAAEEIPAEPDEAPEEAVRWDGELRVDAAREITLQDSKLYRLTLPRRSELILRAAGVPVKITVTPLPDGQKRVWKSAASEAGVYVIDELLTLEKGEYSVAIELLLEDRQGLVSVCFSTPEPDAAEADQEADEEAIEEFVEEIIVEAVEEPDSAIETDEPETPAAVKEEPQENAVPAAESADATEAAAEEPEAEQPDTAESAAEPLTIRVRYACEEDYQPGARIVLTAEVSDPAYQGTIRWQYTADGGETVCDVADAEGAEYSFILDVDNMSYWWRAYLE